MGGGWDEFQEQLAQHLNEVSLDLGLASPEDAVGIRESSVASVVHEIFLSHVGECFQHF